MKKKYILSSIAIVAGLSLAFYFSAQSHSNAIDISPEPTERNVQADAKSVVTVPALFKNCGEITCLKSRKLRVLSSILPN